MRRPLVKTAGLLLIFILILAAFHNAAQLREVYSAPISLRYVASLTKQEIKSVLDYAQSKQNTQGCYPTFWLEKDSEKVKTAYDEFTTRMIIGLGEAALIWPARFTAGGWPGGYDENGCAVSSQLAWQLWGSTDVLGKTVDWNKRQLTVRGVFEGTQPLLYAVGGADAGYNCAELMPLRGSDRRQAAESFIVQAGLALPEHMIYGGSMGFAMSALCWLEVIAFGMVVLLRLAWLCPRSIRRWAWLGLLLAAAILLPMGLSTLPGWLIPTRWSDFGFWGRLCNTLSVCVEEWFSLPVLLKDITAKWLLVKQGMLCIITLLVSLLIARK